MGLGSGNQIDSAKSAIFGNVNFLIKPILPYFTKPKDVPSLTSGEIPFPNLGVPHNLYPSPNLRGSNALTSGGIPFVWRSCLSQFGRSCFLQFGALN